MFRPLQVFRTCLDHFFSREVHRFLGFSDFFSRKKKVSRKNIFFSRNFSREFLKFSSRLFSREKNIFLEKFFSRNFNIFLENFFSRKKKISRAIFLEKFKDFSREIPTFSREIFHFFILTCPTCLTMAYVYNVNQFGYNKINLKKRNFIFKSNIRFRMALIFFNS